MTDTFERRLAASLNNLADSVEEPNAVRVHPRGPRFAVPIGMAAVAAALIGVFVIGDLLTTDDPKLAQPLTAQEFRDRANEVCSVGLAEATKLVQDEKARRDEPIGDDERLRDFGTYTKRYAEIQREVLERLRPLVPPEELRQDFEEYLALIDNATRQIIANPLIVMDPAWKGAPGATARTKRLGIPICNLDTDDV